MLTIILPLLVGKRHKTDMKKTFISRTYWSNYIDSIIDSIKEDKDTIIDLLVYGNCVDAKIIMNLSRDEFPNYKVTVNKVGEKSPFGEEEEDE